MKANLSSPMMKYTSNGYKLAGRQRNEPPRMKLAEKEKTESKIDPDEIPWFMWFVKGKTDPVLHYFDDVFETKSGAPWWSK